MDAVGEGTNLDRINRIFRINEWDADEFEREPRIDTDGGVALPKMGFVKGRSWEMRRVIAPPLKHALNGSMICLFSTVWG